MFHALKLAGIPRLGLSALVGAGLLTALSVEAGAVDARVRAACTGDYLAYCSQHDPDGPGVRKCMRANGMKLSKGCIAALVASGEVSKTEVARRSEPGK
ncbi:MAG: hypothetical protein EKK41_23305 [Hyphomicrobiales bacterium]|nr:MAG: hypothetical protein EKK41_23305 [Hyphomicrobiales bacterium]